MQTTAKRTARYTVAATKGDAARPFAVLAPVGVIPAFAGHYATRAAAARRATYLNVETRRTAAASPGAA